jgi:hypothetical protein
MLSTTQQTPSPRSNTARLLIVTCLGLLIACGGANGPVAPPPPPPPPGPDLTRNVAVAAGDGQSATVGMPVPIPPAVRVSNSTGQPVAGAPVVFAIGTGGGAVTGASVITGAEGVAAVGSWTLGAAGANTLVATVTGATSGSPTTFSATALELVVLPSKDTTVNGVIEVTRFEVPAGITVTLGSDVVIKAAVRATIAGTIRGDCRRFEIDGAGEVLVSGAIDNSCTAAGAAGVELKIVGRGGYSLTGALLKSSGAFEITNDPTLTDASFVSPFPAPAAWTRPPTTDGAVLTRPCTMMNAQYIPTPARASNGAQGFPMGSNGIDGEPVTVRCRGLLAIEGGVELASQHGGNGGEGFDLSPGSEVRGGNGGDGGLLRLQTVGDIVFSGANRVLSGYGGKGGGADAVIASPGGNAIATGGVGGSGGKMILSVTQTLAFDGPTELVIGGGGYGGDAVAEGGDGVDFIPGGVKNGGNATATGGAAGASLDLTLLVGSGLTGQTNATLSGGDGGFGGKGEAVGGLGGFGDADNPDGGDGGNMRATGGPGGNSGLRRFGGALIQPGGDGGSAILASGFGADGRNGCNFPPGFRPGGSGGRGGDLTGIHGVGGSGSTPGASGLINLLNTLGGGDGNVGHPTGGQGGQAGTVSMSAPPVGTPPIAGRSAFACLAALAGHTSQYVPNGPDAPANCPMMSNAVEFVSFANVPVEFTVTYDPTASTGNQAFMFTTQQFNPFSGVPSIMGTTPAFDVLTHGLMGARQSVYSIYDRCVTSGPFVNVFKVTATGAGGPVVEVGTFAYTYTP